MRFAAGGSTLKDTQYVDISGEGGWFQLSHRVYDRAGQPCHLEGVRQVGNRVGVGGRRHKGNCRGGCCRGRGRSLLEDVAP